MPCWTVTANELKMINPDEGLLRATLEELGYTVYENSRYGHFAADHFGGTRSELQGSSVQIIGGKITVSSKYKTHQKLLDANKAVAQGYSRQIVQASAKRTGFSVYWKSETEFELAKRY